MEKSSLETKTEGVLLQAIPYLGKQQILKVLTPDEGLLTFMMKASFKNASALGSPFCIAEWVYRKGPKEIHPLKDGSILDPLLSLRQSYDRLVAAGTMAQDLLRSQLPAKQAQALYSLVCAYFKKLPAFSDPALLVASFRLKLLLQEGLLSLERECTTCQAPAFHLHAGESFCLSHAPFPGFLFSEEEWEQMQVLAFARQFSLLQSLSKAPYQKIEQLFLERIHH